MYLQTHFDFCLKDGAPHESRTSRRTRQALIGLLMNLPPHLAPRDIDAFLAESEKLIKRQTESKPYTWGIREV